MKKQFFRVKQLADQTFLRAEKSEILNHEELQIADQKVEFLRGAVAAITKKIAPNGSVVDIDKVIKKTMEYQLGTTFIEESRQSKECPLFQSILKSCGEIEQQLAKEFGDHETKVEEMVYNPLQTVLENDFPNILKHKQSLKKYCLDKDSASNRYQATGKETLREDMEEADTKVEQSRDALAVEMFSVLAKENELSEYILQLLKLQRSYHESALKNLEMLIPFLEHKIGNSPVRKVFGTSLKEHLRITGKRLAYPLEICITALSEYGLSEEGLFRVAASTTKVKRLKASIDSGCFVALIPEYRDAHVLASLLKLYLRELPEPLLTFHLHKEWLEAAQLPDNHRLEVVKSIVQRLPQENKDNLSYLFQFLSKLTKHPENKMTSSNLAIVMSPNLLWNKHENINVNIGNCVTVNTLIELFIKEVDVLFPEDASKYVTLPENFHEEDYITNHKSSNPNLNVCWESPRPNTRKKKCAPIPPGHHTPHIMSKSDDDCVSLKHSQDVNTSPPSKVKSQNNSPAKAEKKDSASQTTQKVVDIRATVTENMINTNKNQQPVMNSVRYISSAVHPVIHDNRIEKSAKTTETMDTTQIRRKDPDTKPVVPARPSSLNMMMRSADGDIFKRTQCSVYNVANKQQPSYINIHQKHEVFQPGHDNNIGEKEKFLGHKVKAVENENVATEMQGSRDIESKTEVDNVKPDAIETDIAMKSYVKYEENPVDLEIKPNVRLDTPMPEIRPTDSESKISIDNGKPPPRPSDPEAKSNVRLDTAKLIEADTKMTVDNGKPPLKHIENETKPKVEHPKPLPRSIDLGVKNNQKLKHTELQTKFESMTLGRSPEKNLIHKSDEQLSSVNPEPNPNCDSNSNSSKPQKSSHARTRSDGGLIDCGMNVHHLKTLNKPTQPPPPPPPSV
ncbi:unnamed protein product [Acanthoscelides obtectus]|uniref:Rho GTPase-activating protein 17 n=1 Tax=Acanthoscelides obtectus TaxID=200917 RepID=A0A9P0KSC6_ACAOB|nr:unnamed protein product [Acanthoscelides obtectus]CAK1633081.1 Rho GTPase-activating protein 17 [Acanthoscelides obtectus]